MTFARVVSPAARSAARLPWALYFRVSSIGCRVESSLSDHEPVVSSSLVLRCWLSFGGAVRGRHRKQAKPQISDSHPFHIAFRSVLPYLDGVHAIEEIVHLIEQVAATLIAAGLVALSKKTLV
jgi:hypothetical protein